MFSFRCLETFKIIAPESRFLKFTLRAMFPIFSCLVVIQSPDVQKAVTFNQGLSNTQGMKFPAVKVQFKTQEPKSCETILGFESKGFQKSLIMLD